MPSHFAPKMSKEDYKTFCGRNDGMHKVQTHKGVFAQVFYFPHFPTRITEWFADLKDLESFKRSNKSTQIIPLF